MPQCIPWNGLPCVTIAWAPLFDPQIPQIDDCMQTLVDHVARDSGLDPTRDTLRFGSAEEIFLRLILQPNQTAIAVIFGSLDTVNDPGAWCNATRPSLYYNVVFNDTRLLYFEQLNDLGTKPPDGRRQVQQSIDQAFINYTSGGSGAQIITYFRDMPFIWPIQQSAAQQEGAFSTIFFFCGVMFQFAMVCFWRACSPSAVVAPLRALTGTTCATGRCCTTSPSRRISSCGRGCALPA